MISRLILPIFILLAIMTTTSHSYTICAISKYEEERLLAMNYTQFDQSHDGWRVYAKNGCYHEMGHLIDKYYGRHINSLQDWQITSVIWHAGQMYAFNNEYDTARSRFIQSVSQNEPANTLILWNDYVRATVAFIDNDLTALKYYREKIANGPVFNGKKANLDVVDNLILFFGQPYSVAYASN